MSQFNISCFHKSSKAFQADSVMGLIGDFYLDQICKDLKVKFLSCTTVPRCVSLEELDFLQ